jgi:flagellar biosynthesis/type III secretory pathway M-ring protein FliF/YscJ
MPNYAWKVDLYKDYSEFYEKIRDKMDAMARKVAGTCLKGNICNMDVTIPKVYATGNVNINVDQKIDCGKDTIIEGFDANPGSDIGMAKMIAMEQNYKDNKDIFDNIEEKTKTINDKVNDPSAPESQNNDPSVPEIQNNGGDEPDTKNKETKINVGAIVGIVVAIVVFFTIVGICIWYKVRKFKNKFNKKLKKHDGNKLAAFIDTVD